MIYFHKLLPIFLSPIFVAVAMTVYGTHANKKRLGYSAAALLFLLSLPVVSNELFRYVEGYAVKKSVQSVPNAQAVIVLSGMLSDVPSEHGVASEWLDPDRFFAGVDLYKAGKAPRLVFTRGQLPWSKATASEGETLKVAAIKLDIPADAILLTQDVLNTQDEAAAVRQVLEASSPHVILVTSAFHMQRARTLFERQGIRVSPYPVDFKVQVQTPTPMDFLPSARALWLSDVATRELLGRLYYRLTD